MSFTTDVSVREPQTPELRVITTATIPERMSDLPWDSQEEAEILFPFGGDTERPYTVQDMIDDGYMEGTRVSPFVISNNEG